MELNKLLRENLRKYSAYEPGEQPKESGWLKLNTNENPFPPMPAATTTPTISLGIEVRRSLPSHDHFHKASPSC